MEGQMYAGRSAGVALSVSIYLSIYLVLCMCVVGFVGLVGCRLRRLSLSSSRLAERSSSVAVCLSRFVAPAKLATLARRVLHEHMPPSPKRTNQAPTAACPGLLCHLCGKQFGSASLEIHQRKCRLRFEREHGRAAPEAPAGGDSAAAQFYESEVMEACPHCARTFQPGRLEVHLRSCGKGKPPLQEAETGWQAPGQGRG